LAPVEVQVTPSFSRILKGEKVETISQFQVSELERVMAVSAKPPAPLSPMVGEQGNPNPDGADAVEKTEAGQNTRPAAIFNTRAPYMSKVTKSEAIQGWTVPEFKKEVVHRNMEQTAAPRVVEDHSYLLEDARAKADEIIAEAEKNAARIMEEAKTEAESLKQKAFMDGMTTARNEISETLHQVERIFQESQLWQERVMHQSQNRIIEMVLSIGKKLFGSGFELPADQIDHIVSRAINEASRLGNLRIYLNPEDAKLLVNLWQESEITLNGQQIQIVSSQNILRGGCFIDGQFGVVDGRVEEQIDQINDAIKETANNLENPEPEE